MISATEHILSFHSLSLLNSQQRLYFVVALRILMLRMATIIYLREKFLKMKQI